MWDQKKIIEALTFEEIDSKTCGKGMFGLQADFINPKEQILMQVKGFGSSKKKAKQECCLKIVESMASYVS